MMKVVVLIVVCLIGLAAGKCGFKATIKNTERTCPDGWISTSHRSYDRSCFFLDERHQTFDDAVKSCKAMGAELMSINEEETQSRVNSHIYLEKKIFENVWAGGRRVGSVNGTYMWVDGSVFAHRYNNWASRQPDNWGNQEECLELVPGGPVHFKDEFGRWNDVGCGRRNMFLCQKFLRDPNPTIDFDGSCAGKDFLIY